MKVSVVVMLGILLALSVTARRRELPTPVPIPRASKDGPVRYEGVASCLVAGCHGGTAGKFGGEGTTWAVLDPHARAFAVLLEPAARAIEERLTGATDPRPEQNPRCLDCHVEPGIAGAPVAPHFSIRDGVGCESCHGKAEGWLEVHARRRLSPAEKAALGMRELGDFRERARRCVVCHVGQGDVEVDHDLLAAGHPRLRFELSSYLANYPRHWRPELAKRYPEPDAAAWLVGQAVSAEAALRLLARRADSAKPWPELAEFDCYACHHDLTPRSRPSHAGPGLGTLARNAWHEPVGVALDTSRLNRLLGGPRSRQALAREADDLADRLQSVVERLDQQARAGIDTKALLAEVVQSEAKMQPYGWDRAAQLYLAAAALAPPGPLRQNVAQLRQHLQQAFPVRLGTVLEGPSGYELDETRRLWQLIRDELPHRRP